MEIKAIILEDHPMFRMGLRGALLGKAAGDMHITIVGEAASVKEFYSITGEADILLLDILLPDGTGVVWRERYVRMRLR